MRSFDPESVLERLARGESACGPSDLRIDRHGVWHYQGSAIDRLPLVKLFATVLHRAPDGRFWLVTPAEEVPVEVEDAPFVVVEMRRSGAGSGQLLSFRTNVDRCVNVGATHPLRMRDRAEFGGLVPYLSLGRGLEARLPHSIYYELAELAVADPADLERFGVWSGGEFFPLSSESGTAGSRG
jgi:uncharacterized protein